MVPKKTFLYVFYLCTFLLSDVQFLGVLPHLKGSSVSTKMTLKGPTTIFKLGMGFVGGVKKVLLSLHMHTVKKILKTL